MFGKISQVCSPPFPLAFWCIPKSCSLFLLSGFLGPPRPPGPLCLRTPVGADKWRMPNGTRKVEKWCWKEILREKPENPKSRKVSKSQALPRKVEKYRKTRKVEKSKSREKSKRTTETRKVEKPKSRKAKKSKSQKFENSKVDKSRTKQRHVLGPGVA